MVSLNFNLERDIFFSGENIGHTSCQRFLSYFSWLVEISIKEKFFFFLMEMLTSDLFNPASFENLIC